MRSLLDFWEQRFRLGWIYHRQIREFTLKDWREFSCFFCAMQHGAQFPAILAGKAEDFVDDDAGDGLAGGLAHDADFVTIDDEAFRFGLIEHVAHGDLLQRRRAESVEVEDQRGAARGTVRVARRHAQ